MPTIARRSRYERLAATKPGRTWLAAHPECGLAHGLANMLRTWEHLLCDKALTDERRRAIKTRLVIIERASVDFDPTSIKARRVAMIDALESGVALARVSRSRNADTLFGQMQVAKMQIAQVYLGPVDDVILRRAIEGWTRPRKNWSAILPLADALGCGAESGEKLRVQIAVLMRAMQPKP